MPNHLKNVTFDKRGDKLEVKVRDASFNKIYENEVSIHDKKALENLLKDLKAKGIDLIGLIIKKMRVSEDWFS